MKYGIIILAVAAFGIGAWYFYNKKKQETKPDKSADADPQFIPREGAGSSGGVTGGDILDTIASGEEKRKQLALLGAQLRVKMLGNTAINNSLPNAVTNLPANLLPGNNINVLLAGG